MTRKKLKITIECEGNPTQVLEVNGMAAALLTDGNQEDTHGLTCLICGNMSNRDLVYPHHGVENELLEAVAETIVKDLSPTDLLKMLLGGRKHESEG